jgi:alginate O-acetyltransferase complex protein AlgI
MLFNSFQFCLFFPLVTLLYFLLPHRARWFMLLAASCVFYMAFIPVYIFILVITILIDYTAGILIENSVGRRKKLYLIISIISTCLVLLIFKYFNFFNANFAAAAHFFHWNYSIENLRLILPIGLSFHTFQSLSYVIEVYRGHQKAEHHFGIYSLYVMFYPQLVAGPIERPQNLLHQFYEKHEFDYRRVTDGLKLMAWGMFKKAVIADRLAIAVNQVYNNPADFTGLPLIIATIFFAIQIYCDFSGYSDIAIGAAQVMGFKLMTNFRRPYFATSISEFWKRWHISLSTWFRDYLYISLGGNRVAKWRWQVNLLLTFVVSGLWHGANWTFIIWGALNGFYLVFSLWTERARNTVGGLVGIQKYPFVNRIWKTGVTFSLICFAWIFFRAANLSDAMYIISHMFTGLGSSLSPRGIAAAMNSMGLYTIQYGVIFVSLVILETVHILQSKGSVRTALAKRPAWVRWGLYYATLLVLAYFGIYGKNQFIYFQF